MKAVVTQPGATGHLAFAEVPEPQPDSGEALIRLTAFSLNRGEVRRAATQGPGAMIGWDVVGVVEAPARDGSGPVQGTRVVGHSRRMQGWAERIALPTADIAAIPDTVSDANAATLPVAGLTAHSRSNAANGCWPRVSSSPARPARPSCGSNRCGQLAGEIGPRLSWRMPANASITFPPLRTPARADAWHRLSCRCYSPLIEWKP